MGWVLHNNHTQDGVSLPRFSLFLLVPEVLQLYLVRTSYFREIYMLIRKYVTISSIMLCVHWHSFHLFYSTLMLGFSTSMISKTKHIVLYMWTIDWVESRREEWEARRINRGKGRNFSCLSRSPDRKSWWAPRNANLVRRNKRKNEQSEEKKEIRTHIWTNEEKRKEAKYTKKYKEEQNSYLKHGTNDEILIVDHNFATIFRQPDGSAG